MEKQLRRSNWMHPRSLPPKRLTLTDTGQKNRGNPNSLWQILPGGVGRAGQAHGRRDPPGHIDAPHILQASDGRELGGSGGDGLGKKRRSERRQARTDLAGSSRSPCPATLRRGERAHGGAQRERGAGNCSHGARSSAEALASEIVAS